MYIKFGKLRDAVRWVESMGWGHDIQMPTKRWHVKKNYAENFKWKGEAKPEVAYD
jgi:hypothetical protein